MSGGSRQSSGEKPGRHGLGRRVRRDLGVLKEPVRGGRGGGALWPRLEYSPFLPFGSRIPFWSPPGLLTLLGEEGKLELQLFQVADGSIKTGASNRKGKN